MPAGVMVRVCLFLLGSTVITDAIAILIRIVLAASGRGLLFLRDAVIADSVMIFIGIVWTLADRFLSGSDCCLAGCICGSRRSSGCGSGSAFCGLCRCGSSSAFRGLRCGRSAGSIIRNRSSLITAGVIIRGLAECVDADCAQRKYKDCDQNSRY